MTRLIRRVQGGARVPARAAAIFSLLTVGSLLLVPGAAAVEGPERIGTSVSSPQVRAEGARSPRAASVDSSTNAAAIARAMSSQDGLVTGASWPGPDSGSNPSSESAAGVGRGFYGRHMPVAGSTFAALTSGSVHASAPPNQFGNAGADNETSSRNVNDMTILRVNVNVPAGHNCLAFDVAFYSEEYPEYVGSPFNDGFIAELDDSDWFYDTETHEVDAPLNFAFDDSGNELSVNSVSFADQAATDLEYDGGTKLLTAATPVTPGQHALYLTIYDAADHIFDSAVFMDHLRSANLPKGQCRSGSSITDLDGDALPDRWERHGIDGDGDGKVTGPNDLNLPAMGANPKRKDLFIEVDSMDGYRLTSQALDAVVNSFAKAPVPNPNGKTGIAVHIDNGPRSVMNPATGKRWKGRSEASTFPFVSRFGNWDNGGRYRWNSFDAVKEQHFSEVRRAVFHYALSVSSLPNLNLQGQKPRVIAGTSRNDLDTDSSVLGAASDFVVGMGAACEPRNSCVGTPSQQTGVFMHELGHNLGLRHGGADEVQLKPNYLSVMNYSYALGGLVGASPRFDYSRYGPGVVPDLNENALSEQAGLGSKKSPQAGIWAIWQCPQPQQRSAGPIRGPLDWNCSGSIEQATVRGNVNRDFFHSVLHTQNDWLSLRFRGGAVGGFLLSDLLPAKTKATAEPTVGEMADAEAAIQASACPGLKRKAGKARKAKAKAKAKAKKAKKRLRKARKAGDRVTSARKAARKAGKQLKRAKRHLRKRKRILIAVCREKAKPAPYGDPPSPPPSPDPDPPPPPPDPDPPPPKREIIVVYNKLTNGPTQMREDTTPVRLTTKPWKNCGTRGCNINGTERSTGGKYDAATCKTTGDTVTNGHNSDPSDDSNPNLYTSNRYYGVKLKSGTFGYVSWVWINKSDRGGLGLPNC